MPLPFGFFFFSVSFSFLFLFCLLYLDLIFYSIAMISMTTCHPFGGCSIDYVIKVLD
jgi:hypothetical protein